MPRPTIAPSEREIEKSLEGRLNWEPGDPHPLDVLFDHQAMSEALQQELEDLLEVVQQTRLRLTSLLQQQSSAEAILERAEQQAQETVKKRFESRRHFDHIQARFTLLRQQRQRGRLQVAQAMLRHALDVLNEEETLWQEFQTSIQVAETGDQQEEIVHENIRGAHAPIAAVFAGSVERSRQHLRTFEASLPHYRAQLTQGAGWFEVFWVRRPVRLKREVSLLLKALRRSHKYHLPLPSEALQGVHPDLAQTLVSVEHPPTAEDIPKALEQEAYDYEKLGPYAKYRWRTKAHGPIYTISLGPRDRPPGRALKQKFASQSVKPAADRTPSG